MSKRKLSPTVPFSHDYPQKRRFAMDGHSWTQKSTALMFVCLLIGVSAIGSGRTFAHPDPVPNRPPQSTLQISEIMYNPPDGNVYEFVELYNAGAQKFDLDNVRFSAGIDFTFPNDTSLPTGTYLVLASDVSAFSTKYGFAPFGAFAGQLANNGERLTLETSDETELVSVRYDDEVPWPLTADGDGFSLVLHAPDDLGADPDLGENWQASSVAGGSPGAADGADAIPAVLVNEVLPHTDLPLVDAVELYNPSGRAADVGNWFITDDRTNPAQYQIPDGTLIAPYGYLYFTKDQLGFAFNELGEDAFLFSADAGGDLTGYSHGFSFGPSTNGVSFGRYITSTGAEHFTAQKNPTLGDVNAGPLVGPIVISAIHYMTRDDAAEYVELTNRTGAATPLYDPLNPDNSWRLDGVGNYTFPSGVILEARGKLLLVSIDPAEFRLNHAIPDEMQIFGPYEGGLDQGGERLRLVRPEMPNEDGTVPYIEIDAVKYGQEQWPKPVLGNAIQRVDHAAYGDDPANWRTAAPITDDRLYLPSIVAVQP